MLYQEKSVNPLPTYTKLLGFYRGAIFPLAGTFFTYAGISIVGVAFVWTLVEETKNKTLAEVQALYRSKFRAQSVKVQELM
jgi:hypothetical protein